MKKRKQNLVEKDCRFLVCLPSYLNPGSQGQELMVSQHWSEACDANPEWFGILFGLQCS